MRAAVLVALVVLVALAAVASARSPLVRFPSYYTPPVMPPPPTDYYGGGSTNKCSSNINSAMMMCPMIYAPVCGYFGPQVQCFKAPCAQTFSNSCEACQSGQVATWVEGECPTDGGYTQPPVKQPPVDSYGPVIDWYRPPVMPLPPTSSYVDWYTPVVDPRPPTDYYYSGGNKCSPIFNTAAVMCAMNYDPVCGYYGPEVQCFAAPCAQTFSNSCAACASGQIAYWVAGECPSIGDPTSSYVQKPPVMPRPLPLPDDDMLWGGPLVLPVRPVPTSYYNVAPYDLPPATTGPFPKPLPKPWLPPDLVDPLPRPVMPLPDVSIDLPVLWADGGGLQVFSDYSVQQPTGVQCATVRFAACTDVYMPVCASFAGGKNSRQTVSNGCSACSSGAVSYVDGACEQDVWAFAG